MIPNDQAIASTEIAACRGGNIDSGAEIDDDSLGAVSIVAGIFEGNVEYHPKSDRERKSELTEPGEDAVALLVQGTDNPGNVAVGTTDEGVGGDGGGQSHSTAGEDRKDSGETHSD